MYGHMHKENILENTPNKRNCLVFVFTFKSRNSLFENQYFSTLQILPEPRSQCGFDSIWNVEKYWFSRGKFSTFFKKDYRPIRTNIWRQFNIGQQQILKICMILEKFIALLASGQNVKRAGRKRCLWSRWQPWLARRSITPSLSI